MNVLRRRGVDFKELRKQEKKKNMNELEKIEKGSAGLGKFSLKN